MLAVAGVWSADGCWKRSAGEAIMFDEGEMSEERVA